MTEHQEQCVHDWYRFVLSFPPRLVGQYLERFGVAAGQTVLDPFCGTGTTLVEAKRRGIASVGVEFNPMAAFASTAKTDWSPDPDGLLSHAQQIAQRAHRALAQQDLADAPRETTSGQAHEGLLTLAAEQQRLLLRDSISPLPLHKALLLLRELDRARDERFIRHERLALARALVHGASNLHFGPEVGLGELKADAVVVEPWLATVRSMAADLRQLRHLQQVPSVVHMADARDLPRVLTPGSVDAVITSPPYPNEKDYTRTTRLESVVLGFFSNLQHVRAFKRGLVRSNTRGVYKDDTDDALVAAHPEIQRIAQAIEARRAALGKTSGFERLYARVTRLYFGGMLRHLRALQPALRPGAQLAYVVGDQASYLRVMIRTGQLLADLAESIGYEVTALDLFRTRWATATRQPLREEVLVLRWPGPAKA